MSSIVPEDPFGPIKKPASQELPSAVAVNKFHTNADIDAHAGAIHHTLGIKHNQAAPGDHKHNGTNSKKLAEGKTLTGAKGTNTALINLIALLEEILGFEDNTT